METQELKFLLKLVGRENYQGKIGELKPNSKTRVSETKRICRALRDRDLVVCQEEISQIKISSAGKALLKLDSQNLPITKDELAILQACASKTIKPSEIKKVKPAAKRQELIVSLIERGFIVATAKEIKEAKLTERGKELLAEEYNPKGTNPVLSLDLLANYLIFLRKYYRQPTITTDEQILQTIIELDKELNTDNYLPIFHLREKLQPPLSREELDNAIYRLQRQGKLELSSLVEAVHYTPEQIEAGIPQDIGGCLFFLSVN